jgi:hypothetical protein
MRHDSHRAAKASVIAFTKSRGKQLAATKFPLNAALAVIEHFRQRFGAEFGENPLAPPPKPIRRLWDCGKILTS